MRPGLAILRKLDVERPNGFTSGFSTIHGAHTALFSLTSAGDIGTWVSWVYCCLAPTVSRILVRTTGELCPRRENYCVPNYKTCKENKYPGGRLGELPSGWDRAGVPGRRGARWVKQWTFAVRGLHKRLVGFLRTVRFVLTRVLQQEQEQEQQLRNVQQYHDLPIVAVLVVGVYRGSGSYGAVTSVSDTTQKIVRVSTQQSLPLSVGCTRSQRLCIPSASILRHHPASRLGTIPRAGDWRAQVAGDFPQPLCDPQIATNTMITLADQPSRRRQGTQEYG